MTKMDQTSQDQKNFRPKWVKEKKKVKDQTKLEQQLHQTDQVEEPSPKKSRKRERDRATTEQPDQTSSNEMSWTWHKLTNVGGQRYRKTAVTLTDCDVNECPPIIKSRRAQQKMQRGGKKKMEDEKPCGAGKVRGESRITRK